MIDPAVIVTFLQCKKPENVDVMNNGIYVEQLHTMYMYNMYIEFDRPTHPSHRFGPLILFQGVDTEVHVNGSYEASMRSYALLGMKKLVNR